MELSIIIVNYQSKKHLLLCLASINRFLYTQNSTFKNDFEVILVNNENTPLKIPTMYSFINPKIIEVGKNVGFGVAANLGTIMANGKYILFINPDIIFSDSSLNKALKYLDKHPSVGALGLSIINKQRKIPENWSCGKHSTWGNILFRNTINKPWNKKIPQEVDWSSGAGLIIRKNIFRQIKGFDKNFFMYFEDQDICLRIKKETNKKIIYYPPTKIIHFNGQSWNNKKEQKRNYQKSQLYFFKKHNTKLGYSILKIILKINTLFSK